MKEDVIESIQSVIQDLYSSDAVVELERPEEQFGDYSTNVAMKLAKPFQRSPRDIAQEIVAGLQNSGKYPQVGVAGPGFINVTCKDSELVESLSAAHAKPMSGLKVLVEYSDPNPFKPLHAGHLYTTIIGDVIARLVERAGAETIRINYSGDVGLHVAKSMWAIIRELGGEDVQKLSDLQASLGDGIANWMGQRYVEGNNAYEDDERARAEIVEVNKKVYALHQQNDHESPFAQIYWTLRGASYEFFKALYGRLEVHEFDRYLPESEVTNLGYSTVQKQLEKGVFEQSDGAVIFDGEKHGLHKRVFINSEGLPTYETKDVGLSLTKWQDYKFDESIIITANEQAQYMQVVIKAIEQFAPEPAEKTRHITHGVVKMQGGQKMSSRKGSILLAQDILDAANSVGQESGQATQPEVVLAAVKYAFLKSRIGGDVIYDPKESIAMEGNSGPYIQYAHARARSILRKSEKRNSKLEDGVKFDKAERSLSRKLSEYSEILEKATLELSPHIVTTYLYELAQTFNRFYENSKVIGDDRQQVRLWLVDNYATTLKDGLDLLGISAPSSM